MEDKAKRYLSLLENAANTVEKDLQEQVAVNGKKKITGTEFELIVQKALLESGFSETQITHSPQKFPDFIITDKEYDYKVGVEVKKTDSDKWEVIGGSVYESLKNDIDDTYVLMGKLGGKKPEARLKCYKDCLQDLKVTHSPRFYLNLDIPEGEDYLTRNKAEDLLELKGDDLNRKIRQLLRTNKSTWWSEGEITSYATLSSEEKNLYLCDGIALFPEVFGRDYTKFTPWLVYNCLVWCGNVRDIFSAGGVELYDNVYFSAIMHRTVANINKIIARIEAMTSDEIQKYWHANPNKIQNRMEFWISLVQSNLRISNELIQKNRKLKRFQSMFDSSISNVITEEFIDILKKRMIK